MIASIIIDFFIAFNALMTLHAGLGGVTNITKNPARSGGYFAFSLAFGVLACVLIYLRVST